MRSIHLLGSLLFSITAISVTACAGRVHTDGAYPATTYACDATRSIAVASRTLRPHNSDAALAVASRDEAGSHFVMDAVEYVVPDDPRADATERVYDAVGGKLVRTTACTPVGGYSDALARFAVGKSLDQVAKELDTDRRAARKLVLRALMSLNQRYSEDR